MTQTLVLHSYFALWCFSNLHAAQSPVWYWESSVQSTKSNGHLFEFFYFAFFMISSLRIRNANNRKLLRSHTQWWLFLCHIKEVLRWAVPGSMAVVTTSRDPALCPTVLECSSHPHGQDACCVSAIGRLTLLTRHGPEHWLVSCSCSASSKGWKMFFTWVAVCSAKGWEVLLRK